MPVQFDQLRIGDEYERPFLAELWGYSTFHAIGRGVFTPAGQNTIVLFVTREQQEALTQYVNDFDGELLRMDGESGHRSDQRLAQSLGQDDVHLFFRDRHHSPFRYCGEVFLADAFLNTGMTPSRFIFAVSPDSARAVSAIVTELAAHGDTDEQFIADPEGRQIIRQHVTYERSAKNRARAIEIHGTVCKACGFDFNAVYGEDLARDYIEIHHVRSIAEAAGRPIDPATDLIPLCSNCHSMVHRDPNRIMPVEELMEQIRRSAA